jgi:ribosomal protein L13E
MAGENHGTGRLIAVDGTRGKDVVSAAEAVAERLRAQDVACGISRWDASGLFADLIAADPAATALGKISPRTLALIYAADLVFRIRWEIAPVLTSGGIVIAAPYVDSAVAVGVSAGLPEAWLREIFRFAPAPTTLARAPERKTTKGWRRKTGRGYPEFCAALLSNTAAGLKRRKARKAAVAWLAENAKDKTTELSKRGVAELVQHLARERA